MNWKRIKLIGAITMVLVALYGCEKHVTWQEEALLSTGETIIIDRDVKHSGGGAAWPQGQGSIPREHVIRFKYPPKTGQTIEWRSTKLDSSTYAELPLVFDIGKDNTWYIFTKIAINAGCTEYHKYQFENGAWVQIQMAEDIETHPTNLFLGAGGANIRGLITLIQKNQENSSIGYNPFLKQVGPKRKICGY
jgi:hypothetical protein